MAYQRSIDIQTSVNTDTVTDRVCRNSMPLQAMLPNHHVFVISHRTLNGKQKSRTRKSANAKFTYKEVNK